MLRLFKGIALVRLGDFGIALALGNARHGKVHADLGALAFKVGAKPGDHFFVQALGHAYFVHAGEFELRRVIDGNKFGSLADRANGNGIFDDLAANSTSLHDNNLSSFFRSIAPFVASIVSLLRDNYCCLCNKIALFTKNFTIKQAKKRGTFPQNVRPRAEGRRAQEREFFSFLSQKFLVQVLTEHLVGVTM